MPLDMQRPQRIPLSGRSENGELKRIEIDVMDDGSYVVTCIHDTGKEGPMGLGSVGDAKKYTFKDAVEMSDFVRSKVEGGEGSPADASGPEEAGEGEMPPAEEMPEGMPPPPGPPGPPPGPPMRAAARQFGRTAGRAAGRAAGR